MLVTNLWPDAVNASLFNSININPDVMFSITGLYSLIYSIAVHVQIYTVSMHVCFTCACNYPVDSMTVACSVLYQNFRRATVADCHNDIEWHQKKSY